MPPHPENALTPALHSLVNTSLSAHVRALFPLHCLSTRPWTSSSVSALWLRPQAPEGRDPIHRTQAEPDTVMCFTKVSADDHKDRVQLFPRRERRAPSGQGNFQQTADRAQPPGESADPRPALRREPAPEQHGPLSVPVCPPAPWGRSQPFLGRRCSHAREALCGHAGWVRPGCTHFPTSGKVCPRHRRTRADGHTAVPPKRQGGGRPEPLPGCQSQSRGGLSLLLQEEKVHGWCGGGVRRELQAGMGACPGPGASEGLCGDLEGVGGTGWGSTGVRRSSTGMGVWWGGHRGAVGRSWG